MSDYAHKNKPKAKYFTQSFCQSIQKPQNKQNDPQIPNENWNLAVLPQKE